MFFSKNKTFITRTLSTFSTFSLLVCVLFSSILKAAEYKSHKLEGNALVVLTDEGEVSLTALTINAFEVFYQSKNLNRY